MGGHQGWSRGFAGEGFILKPRACRPGMPTPPNTHELFLAEIYMQKIKIKAFLHFNNNR